MAVAGLNTTRRDPASSSNAGGHLLEGSRAIGWSVVAVIAVESLYALWTASRGYFWQDDFIDLQALRQLGFSGRLVEQPVFGHFIPGFNVVDYFISLIVPYPWWLVVLLEVLLFALSLFLLDRLLTILFGRSWLGVALVALAGASFGLVPSLVWWATGLEYLAAIPATLLACIFHVRYLRSGRIREAAFGALSLAVGFAFYDGLFVSVLFIVLMTVLIWPAGPGLHGVAQTMAAHARAWVCYGIPVLLELAWRFGHPGVYITGGSATTSQILAFIGLSWTQTLFPLVVGLDVWVLPTHSERVLAGVLGQMLLVAFVVFSILRRRSAWRAWVLIGSTFFAGAALVGATRAGTYGPGDASDVKYVALEFFLLMIAVAFALMPVRSTPTGPAAASAHSTSDRTSMQTARPAWFRPLVVPAVLAVVLIFGTVLIFDQNRDSESVGSHASHRYFANFAASWAHTTRSTRSPYLWNTEVNPKIVTPTFYPYDTASVTVGRFHPEITFDRWGSDGFMLRPDGSVVPAMAVTEASGLPGQQPACADTHGGTARIGIALDRPLHEAKQRFAVVSYQSATGAVATQSDGAGVIFPKGRGTVVTTLAPTPLRAVAWTVHAPASLCVTGLKVVVPEPSGT